MSDIRLITVDPAHFHAALVHKEMVAGVSPTVHVFAPLGPDLLAHLNRLVGFTMRVTNPTTWNVEVHASPDFLRKMLVSPRGNVVVLAGRNRTKIDTMRACVDAGLHVLADKPWIIRHADFPKLEALLDAAERNHVLVYDIMTERHEITSILQRELIQDPDVFGKLVSGTTTEPAIRMESVHALKKLVAGQPLQRPPVFFDVAEQGDGLADVGTHLVDLVNWMVVPNAAVDYRKEIRILTGERWPTTLTGDRYRTITGHALSQDRLDYFCNNRIAYTVRGIHVELIIRWDLELPAGDTHFASFQGTKSRVEIRQSADRPGPPTLQVFPHAATVKAPLAKKIDTLSKRYPNLGVAEESSGCQITIPAALRIGHEAHFAEVTAEFLRYLASPQDLPHWERPNLLAKYFVTTQGAEMAPA